MSDVEIRKQMHIKICLEENVKSDISTGFENVRLVHRALPEIDLDEVSIKTKLFGKKLAGPLIISAMTGGTDWAKKINKTLAEAAHKLEIGIGVGSQRIAVEKPETEATFKIVRETAPNTLVMGNVGCPQISQGWGVHEAQQCIDMIDADALAIHMNPLQEAVQVSGETEYKGVLGGIKEIVNEIGVPIIMKETGCGIAKEESIKLEKVGVKGLEISGTGGTSWAAVEHHIARKVGKKEQEVLGKALWNWGIPTAISVVETSSSTKLKIIASGGIRTGVEMAKAITLGADAVGIALPLLKKAVLGPEALREHIRSILNEFRVVMFLTGAKKVDDLKRAPAIILGKTAEWLRLRGFDPREYSIRSI